MTGYIQIICDNIDYFKLVATRSLPSRFKHLSEDLAQDAIALAIEKIDRYDPSKGNIKSWLYRLIQNVCFDEVRKLKKLDTTPLSIHIFNLADEKNYCSIEERRQDRKHIRKALRLLNERDRKIIVARFLFSLSGREVADLLGIPENQINVYIRRAKLRLEEQCLAA